MSEVTRPILRYHGGKWKLAPWIIGFFPNHRVYVEPYGGAASVLLRKPRCYAEVYNEKDPEIWNLFRVARDKKSEISQALELTPFSRIEFMDSYHPTSDPVEQARRTVVRSFMGFGSNSHNQATGFRSNSNRSGTTPAHDWANYPEAMQAIIKRLQGVILENRDALEVMLAHDGPETLHYVDPPYLPETRDKGEDYRHEMTVEQHFDLACVLNMLQGMVILSGYPSSLYGQWFSGWRRFDRNALADGARKRVECLWLSPNVPIQQGNLL